MGNCMEHHNTGTAPDKAVPEQNRSPLVHSAMPPPSSFTLADLYDLGPELGRGHSAVIRRCTHRPSGLPFACKSIPKFSSPSSLLDALHEISTLRLLSPHPHVVRLHQVVHDRSFVHLVMELCPGGELFHRLVARTRFPEPRSALILKSLVETIQFCHSMGIIHRDLKPENILLSDSSDSSAIKLADFGLALHFRPGDKFSGRAGSAYYIAPEVLRGQYSEEIDIWSAGVILYVLLSGVPPFWGETDEDIFEAIKEGNLDFDDDPWCNVSALAKDLIRRMLCPDVKARLTPAEILEHPWILYHAAHRPEPHTTKDAIAKPGSEAPLLARVSDSKRDPCCGANISDASEAYLSHVPTNRGGDAAPAARAEQLHLPVHPSISSNSARLATDESAAQASSIPNGARASQRLQALQKPAVGKLGFNNFLVTVITGLDDSPASSCDDVEQIRMRLQGHCTWRLLKTDDKEQTVVVETKQGRFLVVHDKLRRRIGWKPLQEERARDCCRGAGSKLSESGLSQPIF